MPKPCFPFVAPKPASLWVALVIILLSVAPKPGLPLWRLSLVSLCGAQAWFLVVAPESCSLLWCVSLFPPVAPKPGFLLRRPGLIFKAWFLVVAWRLSRVSSCGA